MAIALVGSVGAVLSGSASPLVPAWGVSENRTANNLLICCVASRASSTPSLTTPTGWTAVGAAEISSGNSHCRIYYKIAAGGDAAPSIAVAGLTSPCYAQLSEWSGNDTSAPLDANGSGTFTSGGTYSATAGSNTSASGGLAIFALEWLKSGASVSITWSAFTGTKIGDDATSGLAHFFSAYELGPAAGSAASNSVTSSSTAVLASSCQIAVFKAAAGGAAQIWQPPSTNVKQAVQRASVY